MKGLLLKGSFTFYYHPLSGNPKTLSPAMHRVHHSPERIETDNNYGSIFSFWDRLAGSFRIKPDPHPNYVFGLHGLEKDQGLAALLTLPLRSTK